MKSISRHSPTHHCRLTVTLTILTTCLLWVGSSQAYTVYFDTTLDEVNRQQAVALVGAYQGGQSFLQHGENSLSVHAALGSYGYEAFSGSLGLTWQNNSWLPFGWGLSYTYLDSQFKTRTWALNAQVPLAGGSRPWLMLQGVLGRQVEAPGGREREIALPPEDTTQPTQFGTPLFLVESYSWTHGYLHLMARGRLWIFRPQFDLGYLLTHYEFEGLECPNGDCFNSGPITSPSGNLGSVVWNIGLGLEVRPVRIFAGLNNVAGEFLLVGRFTLVF